MTGPSSRTGRSDLGDSETRLRRLLQLEGMVPLDWAGNITPVLLLGDGTLPGYGSSKLRRWNFNTFTGAGADSWLKAVDDVIIDRISCYHTAAGTFSITYLGPNDADPGAIALRTAPFIDRAVSSQELAPLLNAALNLAGGVAIYTSGVNAVAAGTVSEPAGQPFLLAAGAKIRFVTGGNASWIVEGRTF